MSIKEKIDADLKQALKGREEIKTLTLRMLKASFKNAEINKRGDLTDDELLKIINSEVKKHKEAIESFEQGGREDLAEKEKKELEILVTYLPKQLDEEKIRKIIQEVIGGLSDEEKQNFGKVMGQVMNKTKGQAEGGVVSRLVKEELKK